MEFQVDHAVIVFSRTDRSVDMVAFCVDHLYLGHGLSGFLPNIQQRIIGKNGIDCNA